MGWHAAGRRFLKLFSIYRRALVEARGFWPGLAIILVAGIAWTPVALLFPLPLKLIVDNVLGGKPLEGLLAHLISPLGAGASGLLLAAVGFSVMLCLVALVYHFAEWVLRESLAERMVLGFRAKLLRHAMSLGVLRHGEQGKFDLFYRITEDAPALQWTALYGIMPVLVALANIASTLAVMLMLSAGLTALALATVLPTMVAVQAYRRRLKAKWHAAKEADSATKAVVLEILEAQRIVTLFGQEEREVRRFTAAARRSVTSRLNAIRSEGVLGGLLALSGGLGTAALLYVGAREVMTGALTVGDLLMLATYVGQLYAPLQSIGTHVSGQQHALASFERALALLDTEPHLRNRPLAKPRPRARGEIGFDRVGFAYEGRDPVLQGARFTVPAGSVVGITGRTGSGKTTLVNLMLRLFDPTSGAIRLDGVDLRDWRLADLRRQFAVVPQDPVLFAATVAENIAYGRPDASRDEIRDAADAASAHRFIAALPDGYDTMLGEAGARLSGGERQRIALARALLLDAPVLVLDEPTSAVDQQTESAIVEELERLRRGRTVFIIAHRLATLRYVDMRLSVAGNGVVEVEREPALTLLAEAS